MKSSIKVDYASIYGDNLQDKQPVVRVEVFESDDPRDTLLACIFKEKSQLSVWKRAATNTFIISEKNRFQQVADIASDVFLTLITAFPHKQDINMCTGADEIHFEITVPDPPLKRSKGKDRITLNSLNDLNVIRELVADFKEFIGANS